MSLLGLLNIKLLAETAQFNSAMDKAAAKAIGNMNSISRAARQYLPIITSALSVTAASLEFKRILDDADQIAKLSQKLGIGVESLSVYQHAAKLAGFELEALANGVARLSRNASDAADGLAKPRQAFESLGIEVNDTNGNLRAADDLLLDIADKFSTMADGTRKAALAQELFGRSGVALIPFLNEGRKGIQKIREEAERFGIVLDSKTAKEAEEFNDNMTRLKAIMDGLFLSIAKSVLPILVEYTDQIVKGDEQTGKLAHRSEVFANTLLTVFSFLKIAGAELKKFSIVTGDTLAVIDKLTGDGSFRDSVSGPGINAIRYHKEIGAIIKKSAEDLKNVSNNTNQEIEALWQKHWDRMAGIPEASGTAPAAVAQYQDIGEEFKRLMEEGDKLKESLRSPLEQLLDDQEHLNELMSSGAIDQETYNRAAEKMISVYDKQTEAIKKTDSTMRDLGATFSSEFENAIIEGKKASDVFNALAEDIARIALRKAVLDPIFGGIFGGSGGGGFLSNFFGSARGNVFHNGALTRFATGGVIGSPVAFPMPGGRRGLAGEAGPEAIIPLMRTSGGDLGVKADMGGRTVVNVYVPPGSNVREDRQDDGGIERINIYIDEMVASNIRGGTKTFKALSSTFGLSQKVVGR